MTFECLKSVSYPAPPDQPQTRLHTIDIWLPQQQAAFPLNERVWIVFVHGGAWRNPFQSSECFEPAMSQIKTMANDKDSFLGKVAGFAAPNYRLSPNLEADAPTTPDPAASAKHPDHLQDVIYAIKHLYKQYDISQSMGYILVGPSCGATLAFQVATYSLNRHQSVIPSPLGVIGLNGVYDLAGWLRVASSSVYDDIVETAFGSDREIWEKASPMHQVQSDWTVDHHTAKPISLTFLAYSLEDTVVADSQTLEMLEKLKHWSQPHQATVNTGSILSPPSAPDEQQQRIVLSKVINGGHDEVWEKPEQMLACIAEAVKKVCGMD